MKGKLLFSAILVSFVIASPAFGQAGNYHTDKKVGYKVRAPKGWSQIPIKNEERWIVGKFLSKREYINEDGWGFKPDMRVIIFPDSVTKDRGAKVTRDEASSTTIIEIKNPYKDYEDYLQKNYRGGGWFVSLEKEQKGKNDLEWTLMEIN